MKKINNNLILKKHDYDLLLKYVYSRLNPLSSDYKNAEQLYEELKIAEVYDNSDSIPGDVIRVNSMVEVEEQHTKRLLKFRIVLPAQANLGKHRLSVFAPLSIALIGYRKGQKISWEMPSGEKVFLIKQVTNEELLV